MITRDLSAGCRISHPMFLQSVVRVDFRLPAICFRTIFSPITISRQLET